MQVETMTDKELMALRPEKLTRLERNAVAAELRRRAVDNLQEANELEQYGRVAKDTPETPGHPGHPGTCLVSVQNVSLERRTGTSGTGHFISI